MYCGYHTVFMVMKSFVKTGQLDYNLHKEWEEEKALYEQNMLQAEERARNRLERMISPRKASTTGSFQRTAQHHATQRHCMKQVASAPVTARILPWSNHWATQRQFRSARSPCTRLHSRMAAAQGPPGEQ